MGDAVVDGLVLVAGPDEHLVRLVLGGEYLAVQRECPEHYHFPRMVDVRFDLQVVECLALVAEDGSEFWYEIVVYVRDVYCGYGDIVRRAFPHILVGRELAS